jgi:hypothetical protein
LGEDAAAEVDLQQRDLFGRERVGMLEDPTDRLVDGDERQRDLHKRLGCYALGVGETGHTPRIVLGCPRSNTG